MGKDFPPGVSKLDVEWLASQIDLHSIAECRTAEELWKLQARAEYIILLRQYKAKAEEAD